jgi:hypothetical protein
VPVAAGADGTVADAGVLTVGAATGSVEPVVMPLRDPVLVPERDSSVPPDSDVVGELVSEVVGEPDSEAVGEPVSELVGEPVSEVVEEVETGIVPERDSICWRYDINNDERDDTIVVPVPPVLVVPQSDVDVGVDVGLETVRSRVEPYEKRDWRSEVVDVTGAGAATTAVVVHAGSGVVPLAMDSSGGLAATIATYGAGHWLADAFHCSGVRPEHTCAVAA